MLKNLKTNNPYVLNQFANRHFIVSVAKDEKFFTFIKPLKFNKEKKMNIYLILWNIASSLF